MTMTRPKPKFSSRNLSAVYKAPALREPSGSVRLAGGGRLLVLRAPARPDAAVAPTPINTPSLRKENMGQDVHVSLVPAGGWAHDPSKTSPAKDSEVHETKQAWAAAEPVVAVKKTVFAANSGRWGDEAMEEELAQEERQREAQREKEFPDLRGHDHEATRSTHPGDGYYHAARPVYDDRTTSDIREYRYHDERRQHPAGHHEPPYHGVPTRGYGGSHFSNQDARFDSPSRYPLHHNAPHHEYHHYPPRGGSAFDGYPPDRGYGPRVHRDDDPRSHHYYGPGDHGHPSPPSRAEGPPSVWRTTPHQPQSAPPANVWKMSEAEVKTTGRQGPSEVESPPKPLPSRQSEERHPIQPLPTIAPSSNAVRILKRDGPRMLFDHKSGTMVEVEESTSARRARSSTPPQREAREASKPSRRDSAPRVQPSEIDSKPLAPADSTDSNAANPGIGQAPNTLPDSPVDPINEVAEKADTGKPSASEIDRKESSQPRVRAVESKPKRLPLGGKMKKIVVAYRPVENEDVEKTDSCVPSREDGKNHSTPFKKKPPAERAQSRTKLKPRPDSSNVRVERTRIAKVNEPSEDKRRRGKTKARQEIDLKEQLEQPALKTSRKKEGTKSSKPARLPKSASKSTHRSTKPSKGKDDNSVQEPHAHELDFAEVEVGQGTSSDLADDDGFTTVKSRRTIFLEKKKLREQIAAALSGFHMRGDVKHPNNRVTLPASIARFGKKGLVVELKKSVSSTGVSEASQRPSAFSSSTPVAIPVLPKPFIDVIRPPKNVDRVEDDCNDTATASSAGSAEPPERKHRGTAEARPIGQAKACKQAVPKSSLNIDKTEQRNARNKMNNSDQKGNDNGVAVTHLVESKPVESATKHQHTQKRTHRADMKKETKKVYVPKRAPSASEGDLHAEREMTSPPQEHKVQPDLSPIELGPTASRKHNEKSQPSHKVHSTRTKSHDVASTDTAVVEKSIVKQPGPSVSEKDSSRTPHKQRKSSTYVTKPDDRLENTHKPHQRRKPSVSNAVIDHEQQVKPSSEQPNESFSSAPSKRQRRTSTSKAYAAKNLHNTTPQKIFKKVYVVKTATVSSPSAA